MLISYFVIVALEQKHHFIKAEKCWTDKTNDIICLQFMSFWNTLNRYFMNRYSILLINGCMVNVPMRYM